MIAKILRKQTEDLIRNPISKLKIIELDKELMSELNIIPLHNNKCHYNSVSLYNNLKDKYDIDIYVCIHYTRVPIVHFINGITNEDGSISFIDITLGHLGCRGTYLVLSDDEGNPTPLIKSSSDPKNLIEYPEEMLILFKRIFFRFLLARNFKSEIIRNFIKDSNLLLKIFDPFKYI